jgi:HEAT repeat protein
MASALFAMGRSARQAWSKQVLSALEHTHNLVRIEAVRAAGELELAQARDLLAEFAQDQDLELRQASIWALSQIGGEGVLDLLSQLQDTTEDAEELEFIASALDNLSFTEEVRSFELMDLEGLGDDEEDDEDFADLFEGEDNEIYDDLDEDEAESPEE